MASRHAGKIDGVTNLKMMGRTREESDAEGAGHEHAMLVKVTPHGSVQIRIMC